MQLRVVLWWCYGGAMVVLWWCYGGAMVVLWWCYGGANARSALGLFYHLCLIDTTYVML